MKHESAALVRATNLSKFLPLVLACKTDKNETAELDVYLADTDSRRTQGLMGLSALDKAGMLFKYDSPVTMAYHNKNVGMDLDIAWFDAEGKLIERKTMSRDYRGPVRCTAAYTYVLETPKGTVSVQSLDVARTFSAEQRKKLAKSGAAMSDGSFPIENEQDLKNAISDWGRAGSKPSVKAHIISRAKSLNLTSLLPDGWKS